MKSDHETMKLLQFLLNCASLQVGEYLPFCASCICRCGGNFLVNDATYMML